MKVGSTTLGEWWKHTTGGSSDAETPQFAFEPESFTTATFRGDVEPAGSSTPTMGEQPTSGA